MKIISALGGGGSSFIFRSLESKNYTLQGNLIDLYKNKRRLEKSPRFIQAYNTALHWLGVYKPRLKMLMRPDSFWTDRTYNPDIGYDPNSPSINIKLIQHKSYILNTSHLRSAGIKFNPDKLNDTSLNKLVATYLDAVRDDESSFPGTTVLLSYHWGEYGIFKDLDIETIYLIRDPFNSIISHSKAIRHQKDYLASGYTHINSPEWIDNYLVGPHHKWIANAENALRHTNAIVIRYHKFNEDWRNVTGLPDIRNQFIFHSNNITDIFTQDSINYIYQKTKYICKDLGIEIRDIAGKI